MKTTGKTKAPRVKSKKPAQQKLRKLGNRITKAKKSIVKPVWSFQLGGLAFNR